MPVFPEILEITSTGNPLLTVDHANGRLGIGNAAPATALDITGTVTATGVAATTLAATTLTATAINSAFTNSTNVGTANTGVTAVSYGDGRLHQTVLTFTGLAVGSAVGAANLAFGKLLYTFPAGVQNVSVAYMNVTLTGTSGIAANTPKVGIGSVIASGAVAVLSGTATFTDYITSQTSGAINGTNAVEATNSAVALVRLSGDAKTIHLNTAVAWAAAGDVTATGTLVLNWSTIS